MSNKASKLTKKLSKRVTRHFTRRNLAVPLLVGLILMTIYTLIVAFDFRIEYINPPDDENLIPIPIGYYFTNNSIVNYPRGNPDIFVEADAFYNGTLAVGIPLLVLAHGFYETEEALRSVTEIEIAFRLSHKFPFQYYASNKTTVDVSIHLHRYKATNELRGHSIIIYWAQPGDFNVISAVYFTNRPTLTETLEPPAIHVEPASELQAERTNRVNMGLTIALTYFAGVEGLSLVLDLRKKDSN